MLKQRIEREYNPDDDPQWGTRTKPAEKRARSYRAARFRRRIDQGWEPALAFRAGQQEMTDGLWDRVRAEALAVLRVPPSWEGNPQQRL